MSYQVTVTDDDGSQLTWTIDDNDPAIRTLTNIVPSTTRANRDALYAKAVTALTTNANYLAITTPTAAQVAAQVKVLTQEVQALIRIVASQLSSTDGT